MADFRPFSPCWGDLSFTEAPRTTARCYAGAIFLSRSPFGATARARGVAWPRCPRVAGPGQTTRRRTEPHASTPGPTGVEGAGGTGGICRSAGGRWRGLAGLRPNAPSHTPVHQAPPVWRAPEGPEGTGGLRDRPLRAAGSRVAISRAAGPSGARNTSGATSNTINDSGRRPRAHQAARPNNTPRGARNTSGATRHIGTTKPPSPTGAGRLRQSERVSAGSRRCPDHRDRFPDGRSKCQA